MKFATIGSYLLDDIIQFSIKEGKDYSNVGRYTCINPISLCFGGGFSKEAYESHGMTCANAYQLRMHKSDMTKSIFREIANGNPDYILFDFTEIFSPVIVYNVEEKRMAFTVPEHLKNTGKSIKEDQKISVFELSPQGILNHAKGYVDKLITLFGKDKLILVKTYANYQFFDKASAWKLAVDMNDRIKNNLILKHIYGFLEENYDIKILSLPDLLFNDLCYNQGGAYKLAEVFYKYTDFALEDTIKGCYTGVNDKTLDEIERFIDEKTMPMLAQMANVQGLKKGKELVLLGHSDPLVRYLKTTFNADVGITIDYDRNMTEQALAKGLSQIANQSDKYYLLIPHLYQKANAIVECMKKGFFPNAEKMGMFYLQLELRNLHGEYCDIYNNRIMSKSDGNLIKIKGKGIKCCIDGFRYGTQVNIDCYDQCSVQIDGGVAFNANLFILSYWGSKIHIGDNTTFGLENRIWIYAGGEVSIGKDCMFADKITVQAGDGHAIYDLRTKQNINSDLNYYQDKNVVCLGDHIWIGREAILINCKIGSGSIVGARALVKKTFPNNCIVAGLPAKLIKKDIGWAREINCYDIDDPRFGVPEQYRNFTEE